MTFPFSFMQPMFMPPSMTMSPMAPMPMAPFAPMRAMPTVEQQEEFTLTFLNAQKQHAEKLREYFQECIKALDASVGVIEKEVSKLDAARSKRKSEAASEARSKR